MPDAAPFGNSLCSLTSAGVCAYQLAPNCSSPSPTPIDASHAYETRNIYEAGATAKALYEAIKTGAAAEQQFKFASKQFCAILADSSWMSRLSELAFGFNGALPQP